MVELHSNFTIDGSKQMVNGLYPTNHALHETIEITHGWNDWFETGFYILLACPPGMGLVGYHIRPRVRIPEWHWPVGVNLSTKSATSAANFPSTRGHGRCARLSINKSDHGIGPSTPHSTVCCTARPFTRAESFSPNFKFSYNFTPKIASGLEYYGSLGPVTGFYAVIPAAQQFFPQSTSTSKSHGKLTSAWA